MGSTLYLYGLAPSTHYKMLDSLGAGIELMRYAGLTAIYRQCLKHEFTYSESNIGEDGLNRQILSQISEHDRIVQAVIATSPFFPARFATLYSSEKALLSFMHGNHEAIEAFLSSSEGYREWAVKGYIRREQARDHLLNEELKQQISQPLSPGKRYVQERQITLKVEGQLTQWLKTRAESAVEHLNQLAANIVKRPIPAPVGPETTEECFGNWALLLADSQIDALKQVLDDINAREATHGLNFVCTGPWALYSFIQNVSIKN